jgi:hypothetical protein
MNDKEEFNQRLTFSETVSKRTNIFKCGRYPITKGLGLEKRVAASSHGSL